ncbi:MAG: 3-hydroxyacyl-CoA dehydrogenase family protein [Pirellulaceae bacterium]
MKYNRVGIIGLGIMGRGICTALVAHGIRTIGLDIRPESFAQAKTQIEAGLAQLGNSSDWQPLFEEATDLTSLADCDFVIENLPEELALKRKIIASLEEVVRPETPIASNTSALPITLLQQGMKHPERIVGMHWAEPCHLTQFLEIIRGDETSAETAESAAALGRMVGKDPTIVLRDVPGFIVNRLAYAMYREAFWMLENGVADVETIDRTFIAGFSIWANVAGPFRWMDLTGLPAYAEAMARLLPELSQATEVPPLMRELVDSGALGIANGRGFYQYSEEEAEAWRQKIVANVKMVHSLHASEDRGSPR